MAETRHVIEFIPAYALGCLEEDETIQVIEHLAGCAACQAELASYAAVTDCLGLAAVQAAPSPRVLDRLLSEIQAEQAPAQAGWRARLAGWFRRAAPAWSLVSLVLVAALFTSTFLLRRQVQQLTQARPALQVINLSGAASNPLATGVIVVSVDGEHGTMVVDRLPIPPAGKEYQLWLTRYSEAGAQRASGGVFSVDKYGYGAVWVHAPEALISYTSFGVTLEPSGGSPEPTGERVLYGGH